MLSSLYSISSTGAPFSSINATTSPLLGELGSIITFLPFIAFFRRKDATRIGRTEVRRRRMRPNPMWASNCSFPIFASSWHVERESQFAFLDQIQGRAGFVGEGIAHVEPDGLAFVYVAQDENGFPRP